MATLLVLLASCGGAQPASQTRPTVSAPDSWFDVTGAPRNPFESGKHPATVLLFIAPDCPISNGYAPEIKRIAAAYEPRGVGLFAVHADPRVSRDTAQRHAREYGYEFPVLMDPGQTLAHRVGATATPQAAVLDREGKVVYLGRIDDAYYGFGKRRATATSHDLRDALDAVLTGKPVPHPRTTVLGCEIPPPLPKLP
jgi:thiol-disulfide isomerase/thioredoxin